MYVDEFLKEHGIIKGDRYIVMAIGTTWDTKNYPVVHWAKIVNYLYEKDICVVIIGGMNENKYIEELDKIISKDRYVNLVGLTDLRQMAIVISRSTVVVSGDSGPMHMAYSLGRFVIALIKIRLLESTMNAVAVNLPFVHSGGIACLILILVMLSKNYK